MESMGNKNIFQQKKRIVKNNKNKDNRKIYE